MSHTDSPNTTLLHLHGIGVPPYSARGLTDTLTPIAASRNMRRTINGRLRDVSAPQFQKYAITISGSDQQPPACDGVWPGRRITVEMIQELCYETATDGPGRTPVPGSERVEGDFTFYRPVLDVLVTNWEVRKDEYGAVVSWTLEAEEV
jgi:hypothetical protein